MQSCESSAAQAEAEAATREYARYADSAGGWSAIAGGVLALGAFAVGAVFPPSPIVRAVLIAIPLLWLLLKPCAARYQRSGSVVPASDGNARRIQRWLLVGIVLIIYLVVGGKMLQHGTTGPLSLNGLVYPIGVLVIPIVAWRFLRTPLDLVTGTFLLCQAALAAGGVTFALVSVAWIFVPASLLPIAHGVRDHRRSRSLHDRIMALRRALRVSA